MQPIFTMQYGEFAVADYLSKKIKGTSVFIPASAQEKGIDLLLYRYDNGCNKTNTIQVKMSRTYYNDKEDSGYPFYLWFNRSLFSKTQTGIYWSGYMQSILMNQTQE